MNRIIKNVLQISRRQQSKPESIEALPFFNQFKHEFCLVHPCEFVIKLPRNKKKTIFFDKSQLDQVLVILCENAIQHGRDQSGHVKITISLKSSAQKTILTICDTGPGVSEHHRDHIFDPFFSTLSTGYGMGLFIARDLCEINQAHLSLVESHQGCCFTITFNQNNEIRL